MPSSIRRGKAGSLRRWLGVHERWSSFPTRAVHTARSIGHRLHQHDRFHPGQPFCPAAGSTARAASCPALQTNWLLLPHNDRNVHRRHRGSQRPRDRCRGRTDDHARRPGRRNATADGARVVAIARRLTDDRQRGVADPHLGRGDRRPRQAGHVRAPTDRARHAEALSPGHRGPRSLRARPVDRYTAIVAAPRSRPGCRQGQSPVADIELPRPSGAPGARSPARRRMAVPRSRR